MFLRLRPAAARGWAWGEPLLGALAAVPVPRPTAHTHASFLSTAAGRRPRQPRNPVSARSAPSRSPVLAHEQAVVDLLKRDGPEQASLLLDHVRDRIPWQPRVGLYKRVGTEAILSGCNTARRRVEEALLTDPTILTNARRRVASVMDLAGKGRDLDSVRHLYAMLCRGAGFRSRLPVAAEPAPSALQGLPWPDNLEGPMHEREFSIVINGMLRGGDTQGATLVVEDMFACGQRFDDNMTEAMVHCAVHSRVLAVSDAQAFLVGLCQRQAVSPTDCAKLLTRELYGRGQWHDIPPVFPAFAALQPTVPLGEGHSFVLGAALAAAPALAVAAILRPVSEWAIATAAHHPSVSVEVLQALATRCSRHGGLVAVEALVDALVAVANLGPDARLAVSKVEFGFERWRHERVLLACSMAGRLDWLVSAFSRAQATPGFVLTHNMCVSVVRCAERAKSGDPRFNLDLCLSTLRTMEEEGIPADPRLLVVVVEVALRVYDVHHADELLEALGSNASSVPEVRHALVMACVAKSDVAEALRHLRALVDIAKEKGNVEAVKLVLACEKPLVGLCRARNDQRNARQVRDEVRRSTLP